MLGTEGGARFGHLTFEVAQLGAQRNDTLGLEHDVAAGIGLDLPGFELTALVLGRFELLLQVVQRRALDVLWSASTSVMAFCWRNSVTRSCAAIAFARSSASCFE